jgi:hypothetical protein
MNKLYIDNSITYVQLNLFGERFSRTLQTFAQDAQKPTESSSRAMGTDKTHLWSKLIGPNLESYHPQPTPPPMEEKGVSNSVSAAVDLEWPPPRNLSFVDDGQQKNFSIDVLSSPPSWFNLTVGPCNASIAS